MIYKPSNLSNSIWNLADSILYPVVFLGLTPFFLSHLGVKMFGVYILSNSILISLQVFNLGVGYATMRNVARFRNTGNGEKINETINANLSIASVLFFVTGAIGLCIALLVRYGSLFNIEGDLRQYTSVCIAIAASVGGLKFLEQVIQFSFRGFERFDLSGGFNITIRLGGILINALIVYLGSSVMTMLLVNLAITFVMLLAQLRGLKVIFPLFRLHFGYSWQRIREELDFGVWVWLQSLVTIIMVQSDRYVVTYLGLETLSYYALTATIFNQSLIMISSVVPWFSPRIAGMKERNEDIVPLYKTMQALIVTFGTLALICFFILRQPILTLWVGHDKFIRLDDYIPLFTGYALFAVTTVVPIAFFNAAGLQKLSFRTSALMAVLVITGILSFFYSLHSAQGVIMGMITGIALYIPIMHYVIYRVTDGRKIVSEVLLTALPAIFGVGFIFSEGYMAKGISFALILLSLRWVYFTKDGFDMSTMRNK